MSRTAFVLLLLPLAANSLGFPTGGGGGCCCGGGAPACAPLAPPCASSCGSYGGGSSFYGGGGGGYSQGYAAASAAYAQQPQAVGYASAPQQSGGGYVQAQAPVPSYSAPVPAPSYSAPSAVGYANSAPAPSYIPSVPAPAPSASAYGSAPPPPPPPPPSNYAGSGTQYEQVNPSAIQKEGQYNEGTGAAAAAGGRLAVVEDAETAAGAELSAVAANATANEPTPPIDISLLKLTNDTECNSEDLREIIEQNISDDLNTSKRLIQIASEAKFGGRFDVICSQNDFSYLSNTELFCQHAAANQVSCYAYRQL
ncbi:Ground-like domain-containing protein [Aphelenchoides fujianensis]|nr:Ground-like domain-containing protein [Aphelenchoides fujianensis]